MPRVDLSRASIDEIVLDEECVPGIDKIDGCIVSDLKVTVQPKEPLEGAVDGVVESDGVETVVPSGPKEILVIIRGDVDGFSQTWGPLHWLSATSTKVDKLSICADSGTQQTHR